MVIRCPDKLTGGVVALRNNCFLSYLQALPEALCPIVVLVIKIGNMFVRRSESIDCM